MKKNPRFDDVKRICALVLFLMLAQSNNFGQDDVLPESAAGLEEEKTLRENLLDVDAARQAIADEAPPALFSIDLFDNDVSLFLSGFWKGSLTAKWGIAAGPLGVGVAENDSPLLFTQEADLSLGLWIKERWFVEAAFEEDYSINTYRAGYQGKTGEAVQYLGVGNTGLDFPEFPYLDLGGDSASSFGLYGRFGGGPLQIHSLIRWDDAVREERSFVGGRERSYSYLEANSGIRGISFTLPDDNIPSAIIVYFEDKDGGLIDGRGQRWREAKPSEYAVSSSFGLVELRKSPDTRVAVSYAGNYTSSMGDYAAPGTFLGDVQAVFSEVNLKEYPQPGQEGGETKPAVILIAGISALIIYEKGTFSPFENRSRYDSPNSYAENAALVDSSDDERVAGFDVNPLSETAFYNDLPLYVSEETGERIIEDRRIYELSRNDTRTDLRNPLARWPLALDLNGKPWNYQVYLFGGESYTADVRLRFTNYGASSDYNIGKDVVPGSVKVTRSGLDDPNFSFDASSGSVRLQTPAGFNEIIRISYLKRSSERRNGSLAIGLGAVYSESEHFNAKGALGFRWNMAADSFSEEGASSPGTIGFGGMAAWNYENLKADVKLGFGFTQPDTTGLYRAAGMEGNEQILPLSETASFISNAPKDNPPLINALTAASRAALVYRNYRNTDALGGVTLMNIDWDGAKEVSGKDGPYSARDPALGGEILAAEFTLAGDKNWTGFQSPLGDGGVLQEARTIEVPFRFYNFSGDMNSLRVVIQFGDLAAKDSAGYENPSLILERQLYPPVLQGAVFDELPHILKIELSDADRRRLGNAKYLRIIAVNDGTAEISGRVLLAPPIIRGAKFAPLTVEGGEVKSNPDEGVSTIEMMDESLRARYPDLIDRLHPEGARQRVLFVSWQDIPQGRSEVGAGGRVGSIPFSNYKTLAFFVKGPFSYGGNPSFDFIVARGRSSLGKNSETAVKVSIPVRELNRLSGGSWVSVELRYDGGKNEVYVGGHKIDGSFYYNPQALRKNETGGDAASGADSAYIMAFLNGADGGVPEGGSFGLDEIILLDGASAYSINSGGSFNWSSNEAIVRAGGVNVLEAPAFATTVESGARGDPWNEDSEAFFAAVNRSRASIRFLGIDIEGNAAFSAGTGQVWWNAGHKISRSLGPLRLAEAFFVDPYGESWDHEAEISLSGNFSSSFNARTYFDNGGKNRTWRAGLGMSSIAASPVSFLINTEWRWANTEDSEVDGNYGQIWGETWQNLIPDDGSAADSRRLGARFETSANVKPIGFYLSVNAGSYANKSVNNTESSASASLGFPFSVGSFTGSFRIERDYRRFLFYSGLNAGDDMEKFAETFSESAAVYGDIPFYSLFDPELGSKLTESLSGSASADFIQYAHFNDKYQLFLQLPETYALASLFTPRSFEAHINRGLTQRFDTQTDVLGTGGSLRFSAINMFGAFGAKPLFKIYENDEFNTSLGAAVAFPKGEDASWRINMGQVFIFYGFKGAQLQFEDAVTLLSDGWLGIFKLDWISPAEKSLLGMLYNWFFSTFSQQTAWPAFRELALANIERIRQETVEFSVDETGDYGVFTFSAQHKSIIRILGRLNLDVFARLGISRDDLTEITNFIGTVGTSLNISY
ncbi:MAG: hypothetical protein LBC27_05175 [Spirochaetaceae bacterium]|nr:hypothetical protein [Spirochaetaceae bacterium]